MVCHTVVGSNFVKVIIILLEFFVTLYVAMVMGYASLAKLNIWGGGTGTGGGGEVVVVGFDVESVSKLLPVPVLLVLRLLAVI